MSDQSYFWANLGILQKVGVWSPFYNDEIKSANPCKKYIYDIYRTIIITFCALHTFTECFLICYDIHSLSLDELTVSVAYGIQHFLGIVKVYIIINQQKAIVDLDNKTKQSPLYRNTDEKFKKALTEMVNLSDKIGYIYWFCVLFTISFGCMTGVYITIKNKNTMEIICREKLNFLLDEYGNDISNIYHNVEKTNAFFKIEMIEQELSFLNISLNGMTDFQHSSSCTKSKRVFPYHVWFPFDSKKTPIYQILFVLNFLAGFLLVCCILPIDLMVMSYMRYVRFQFDILCMDLRALRENSINDLELQAGSNKGVNEDIDKIKGGHYYKYNEDLLSRQMVYRLRQIVHHQLAIFDFFQRTDDLFTWILFAQYLGSSLMICGVLFTISSVVDDMLSPKFLHVAFFYSGLIFQLYSNCFYGNEVFVKSSDIAECVYFSGWQECGKFSYRLKPYIMMIMVQSKRPCKLTAGKFAAVDLPTFVAVFKASYTYYTVLADNGKNKPK